MPEVPSREDLATISDPADRLVHAGARLLVDDGFRILAAGLSPDVVTGLAGRTRRTFYDHFETKEDFTRAVFDAYLRLEDHANLTTVFTDAFDELIMAAEGDIIEAVSAISAALFPASTTSEENIVQSIAWSAAVDDEQVRAMLDDYFVAVDGLYEHVVERALDEWGQKLRPPWTVHALTLLLRAIIDGFQVRNRVQPETADHEFFARCILAMVTPLVQHDHEAERPFGDELRGLSRQNVAAWRDRHDRDLIANTRQRVLDSVGPALREAGPGPLTLDAIARWADVGIGALRQVFASADEVVAAAILDSLPGFDREIDFDLASDTMDVRKVLQRHLLRLAQWTADHPGLAHAALTLPLLDRNRLPDDPASRLTGSLARPASRILELAAATGDLRTSDDQQELAGMLTQHLLARSIRPQGSDRAAVAWLTELALGPEEA